jgi:hypothetical protein
MRDGITSAPSCKSKGAAEIRAASLTVKENWLLKRYNSAKN